MSEEPVCPACHHHAHDPGSCPACPHCELHTDEALAFVLRYEPELLGTRRDLTDVATFLDKYGRANTSGERHVQRMAALKRAKDALELLA